jgi:hypothetical protein
LAAAIVALQQVQQVLDAPISWLKDTNVQTAITLAAGSPQAWQAPLAVLSVLKRGSGLSGLVTTLSDLYWLSATSAASLRASVKAFPQPAADWAKFDDDFAKRLLPFLRGIRAATADIFEQMKVLCATVKDIATGVGDQHMVSLKEAASQIANLGLGAVTLKGDSAQTIDVTAQFSRLSNLLDTAEQTTIAAMTVVTNRFETIVHDGSFFLPGDIDELQQNVKTNIFDKALPFEQAVRNYPPPVVGA